MRRTATAVLAIAAAVSLAGTTPALASEHEHGSHGHAASHPAKAHHHAKPAKAAQVTLTGSLVSSDTATSTITIAVKGGTREFHGKTETLNVDPEAIIRRNDQTATAADLQPGDHLSVKARRDASGTVTATRINADSETPEPSPSASSASAAPDAAGSNSESSSASPTPTSSASPQA